MGGRKRKASVSQDQRWSRTRRTRKTVAGGGRGGEGGRRPSRAGPGSQIARAASHPEHSPMVAGSLYVSLGSLCLFPRAPLAVVPQAVLALLVLRSEALTNQKFGWKTFVGQEKMDLEPEEDEMEGPTRPQNGDDRGRQQTFTFTFTYTLTRRMISEPWRPSQLSLWPS